MKGKLEEHQSKKKEKIQIYQIISMKGKLEEDQRKKKTDIINRSSKLEHKSKQIISM
jgi:hypothetical protein